MEKQYFVYILTSKKNGTLYVGITSDIKKRIWEHKNDLIEGFTKKYEVHKLVYFELYDNPIIAIEREKTLKNWNRSWKIKLIENLNPNWQDLYSDL